MRWPPPGLERMQGDLWRVSVSGAFAAALLVAPVLFVVERAEGMATLGPFRDAWWVPLLLSAGGLAFAIDAYVRGARLLRRSAQAVERGYDLHTVGLVVADRRRDMGFLVRGARHFSQMGPEERRGVATFRIASALSLAIAGLWLPLGLGATLLLAARDLAGAAGIALGTLIPAGFGYAFGVAVAMVEEGRVRRARRDWYTTPWSLDLVAEEIEEWRAEFEGDAEVERSPRRRGGVGAPELRRIAWLVLASSVVVAIPILTLLPVSMVGPVLAMVSVPRFEEARSRAARAEAWRSYRVEADGVSDAAEAGRLYHALLHTGDEAEPLEGERAAAETIGPEWFPGGRAEGAVGVPPNAWPDTLFAMVARGLTDGARSYLEGLAAHPGQAAYARLAAAWSMDVAAARWVDPLPEGMTLARLPLPRVGPIREASLARIGAAGLDLAEGRPEAAERKLREVVSVGLLMADEAPTLLENIVGLVVAGSGARGLRSLWEATGREEELVRLDALEGAAARAAAQLSPMRAESLDGMLAAIPGAVLDTASLRGLRWELFAMTATLAPCLNLSRMVLGPGEDYPAFLEEARAALVRHASEAPLFELARGGFWGVPDPVETGLVGRVLGVSMRGGVGSCRSVVRQLHSLREVM